MSYFRIKGCGPLTYTEGGTRRIYNFLPGNQGPDNSQLYVEYWDGARWRTTIPAETQALPNILSFNTATVTYRDDGPQKLYAFVYRADNHVWVCWWDGGRWQWADQGGPGPQIITDLSAISFVDDSIRKIHVFAAGSDNHLYVNWWDGARWRWADLNTPGTRIVSPPAAISYSEAGTQKVYVFVGGGDNHLHVCYWDGDRWRWSDQGDTFTRQAVTAVTFEEEGIRKIYAFTLGADGRLRVNWWDGNRWQWADQGFAGRQGVANSLSAVTYDVAGRRLIFVFAVGPDSRLHVNWWDGGRWRWQDQGTPGVGVSQPVAIAYHDPGGHRIFVFVTGHDHLPYANWWDGSRWAWHRFRIWQRS